MDNVLNLFRKILNERGELACIGVWNDSHTKEDVLDLIDEVISRVAIKLDTQVLDIKVQ